MRLVLPVVLCLAATGSATADPETCLADAKALAARVGATTGRQTSQVVFLLGTPATEASFGCATAAVSEDVFVAYHSARIPNDMLRFVGRAGAALTGADAKAIEAAIRACIPKALAPDAGEMAEVERPTFTVECHAFVRDGGGGAITFYKPR